MSQQSHRSDPGVLNRRTLESDHRVLAKMLRPGMKVLDVGCGTGAITAGIARAVGPSGRALGVDRDESLLEIAWRNDEGAQFVARDLLTLDFDAEFDIVTAARVLQWISDPARAVERMVAAVKPGGRVVVLDYNHDRNSWSPDPPPEFQRFYAAFLEWRASNGWNNAMADHLPALFEAAGLADIESIPCDEVVERGGPDVWTAVIDGIGAKFYPDDDRACVLAAYHDYRATRMERQTLSLRTVVGTRRGD
jgi:SAM-dependent methyltransferase